MENQRKTNYPIEPIILNRRSLRSLSGEDLTNDELFSLFEAARWAPSSYNNQPWRFIYGKKGTEHFDRLFALLIDFNKSWAKNASVLVCVVSKKTFDKNDKKARTHSFDTGMAFENLALEGTCKGFVIHPMEGFNYDKAKIDLNIPDNHQVEAMVAIGKPAPKETLPPELLEKEAVSQRRPLEEIVFEGTF